MELIIENDTINIDWDNVVEILKKVGMSNYSSEIHQQIGRAHV